MTTTLQSPPASPPVVPVTTVGTVPPDPGDTARPEVPGDTSRTSRWAVPAVVTLLVVTAVAYLWDLSASGYANSFYAAAVQAGTRSWKAFFFGSIDSSNFITVDKSPASLWVMELSGRLFGFSSWSMLVPQVLEGVAAVGLLYATVRRWFGVPAGLVAGAALACTPVAALMFRFNNPDALMVLLLVAAAYTLVRALERAGTRWLVATGALIGFAFLAKMLQAFTVLPAFAGVYLVAAPTGLRRRLGQLVVLGVSIAVAAGWWVATVALWPASSRPIIDGSTDNSILNLIFGYNGLSRLSGGTGAGGNFSGPAGLFRLFDDLMGGQASWLLPAALLALVAGVVARWRRPRTDRVRAAFLLWGGWLLVTGAVFSLSSGVIHTYYTVALAPAVAALVAMGGALGWRHRDRTAARVLGAVAVVGTSAWAFELLGRTPGYVPWLRWAVLVVGAASGILLLAAPAVPRWATRCTAVGVGLGLVAMLSGPVAYTATTLTTPHTGSIPSAGPTVADTGTGFGGGAGGPGHCPPAHLPRAPPGRRRPGERSPVRPPVPPAAPALHRPAPGRVHRAAARARPRPVRRWSPPCAPMPRPTDGPPPPSGRSPPPPWSSRRGSRSWPSAGSTARAAPSRWRCSGPTWRRGRSTGSSCRAVADPAARRVPTRPSPPGSRPTSPGRPSAARPSTT